jgi:hypothetical protein
MKFISENNIETTVAVMAIVWKLFIWICWAFVFWNGISLQTGGIKFYLNGLKTIFQ